MERSELAKKKDCTKRVGFVVWWRRLFDFLCRSDGGSCPYKKTEVEKHNSSQHSGRKFFQSARSSWQNYPSAIPNSFTTFTGFFLKFCPSQSRPVCPMAATFHRQNRERKNHEKPQTPTQGSRVPPGCRGIEWASQENKGCASLIRSQWDKKRRVYVHKTDTESKDKLKRKT